MSSTFITLASYDWRLLPQSIAGYHGIADEVLVGLDAGGLTWAGAATGLSRAQLELALAPFPKARIVEGNFFDASKAPIDNDTAERAHLAGLAQGEWIVEVDADEIVDGHALLLDLHQVPPATQVYASWLNVFKVIDGVALVVDDRRHLAPLATRSRIRKRSRVTGEAMWLARQEVPHLTLGRSEAEVAQKLSNWGHAPQVRPGFFDLWRSIDLGNYRDVRNVHPFIPDRWPVLKAVETGSLPWWRPAQAAA
jgi:hypothetical protein